VWAQDDLEGETTSIVTLHGRRMGIVGLGAIGEEIARLVLRGNVAEPVGGT
jgi:phosphoglycerate dehydrogenase-like enzyme